MYYGNKSVAQMDSYYGINHDGYDVPGWKVKDCEKIQQAFNNHAIMLTLAECKDLYSDWSDRAFSASWESGISDMSEDELFSLLLPELRLMLKDRTNRISSLDDQLHLNGYAK